MAQEVLQVKCACGRVYNAAALFACPACGEPVRAAAPIETSINRGHSRPDASAGLPAGDPSVQALRGIQRSLDEQTRYLQAIRWSLIPIGIAVVVIFCALVFGWIKIDLVVGPAG